MATPARHDPAPRRAAKIGTCDAEFEVTAAEGPLSAPETLLAAVRREILPALSDVLDAPPWCDLDISIDQIEIDLGDWPDDPVWSEVRYVLAHKLEAALKRHPVRAPKHAPQFPQTTAAPEYAPDLQSATPPAQANLTAQQGATGRADPALRDTPIRATPDASRASDPADFTRQQRLDTPQHSPQDHPTGPDDPRVQSPASAGPDTASTRAQNAGVGDPETQTPPPAHASPDHVGSGTPLTQNAEGHLPASASNNSLYEANQTHIEAFLQWRARDKKTVSLQRIIARLTDHPHQEKALRAWLTEPVPAQETAPKMPAPLRALVTRALAARAPVARTAPLGSSTDSPMQANQLPPAPPNQQAQDFDIRTLVAQISRHGTQDANAIIAQARRLHPDLFDAQDQSADTIPNQREKTTPRPKPGVISRASSRLAGSLHRAGAPQRTATHHAARLTAQLQLDDDRTVAEQTRRPQPELDAIADPIRGTSAGQLREVSTPDTPSKIDADTAQTTPIQDPDLQRLAARFDLDPARPIAAALAQYLRDDPTTFFTRAGNDLAQKTLAVVLRAPGCDLVAILSDGRLTPLHLRALFAAAPALVEQALYRVSAGRLRDLALGAVPPQADLLRDALNHLAQTARSPETALRAAVLTLLRGQPLDIDSLLHARASKPPDTAQTSAQNAGSVPDQNHAVIDQTPDTEITTPRFSTPSQTRARANETPLETLLALDGFSADAVRRVLDAQQPPKTARMPDTSVSENSQTDTPDAGQHDAVTSAQTPPTAAPRQQKTPEQAAPNFPADGAPKDTAQPSDADLLARLNRLAAITLDPSDDVFAAALRLVWRAWPHAAPPAETTTPAQSFPLMRLLLEAATAPGSAQQSLAQKLALALKSLVQDDAKRAYALRLSSARLASLPGPDATGLNRMTRDSIEQIIADPTLADPDAAKTPMTPVSPVSEPHIDPDTLLVSETAGLILLHPFYVLLFERLKIERDGKRLASSGLPMAFGLLASLAGTQTTPAPDPLHRVLLGMAPTGPTPDPVAPDADAIALMDGLLRSVIDRWGRLGATSPDGLRDTFLRRTGTLRQDENGVHLRVTPGPFDMLLESLPWSLGPVTLPWMPLPCHVTWREDTNA